MISIPEYRDRGSQKDGPNLQLPGGHSCSRNWLGPPFKEVSLLPSLGNPGSTFKAFGHLWPASDGYTVLEAA